MSILFSFLSGVLGVVFIVVAAVVVLSCTIAWYEYANREPQLVEDRFSGGRLAFALGLIASETLCLAASVLVHPLGWTAPREKMVRAEEQTPVIFLHGLFHNRACWLWLKYRLRRRGVNALYTLNLPPWKDVETLTERVAKKVDELRHATGVDKVSLVGHSMGGIIARNYLQLRGGADKVAMCVLLGTPNAGSKLAPFALSPLGKLVLPGSPFLHRLAEAPLPPETRVTSIYSRHDNIILPFESARLEGSRNEELAGMGHTALLYRSRVFETLLNALRKEEP
ncbi:alpha/beta fold hydrolase [uncultured Desulfuromonas sp.]|uniref:esterase/lipase family protein n=1 Tax=uncultured Desulfuromonas sp. TaxID=181013 RepID=UPI002626BAD7|nr:alpha/beta fold hydrolase [uncultured Desulfuromonas sp.]